MHLTAILSDALTATLFMFLALVCEVLGTIGGFGSSLLFVPLAGFFFPFETVLGLTAVMHVGSNLSKLVLFGKHVQFKLMFWIGIPSVVCVLLGAWLTSIINLSMAPLFLGVLLVFLGGGMLLFPKLRLAPSPALAAGAGGLAGFLAGLFGTGGVVRGLSLAAFDLEKFAFVATSAAIDMGVDVSRGIVYAGKGYITSSIWVLGVALVSISFAGSWIGKRLLQRLHQERFRQLVLLLTFAVGVVELVRWFLRP